MVQERSPDTPFETLVFVAGNEWRIISNGAEEELLLVKKPSERSLFFSFPYLGLGHTSITNMIEGENRPHGGGDNYEMKLPALRRTFNDDRQTRTHIHRNVHTFYVM